MTKWEQEAARIFDCLDCQGQEMADVELLLEVWPQLARGAGRREMAELSAGLRRRRMANGLPTPVSRAEWETVIAALHSIMDERELRRNLRAVLQDLTQRTLSRVGAGEEFNFYSALEQM